MFISDFYRNYHSGWPAVPTTGSLAHCVQRLRLSEKTAVAFEAPSQCTTYLGFVSIYICKVVEKIRGRILAAGP